MDLSDTPEQARYREAVRAWLARTSRRSAARPSGSNEDTGDIAGRRRWQGALAEGGLRGRHLAGRSTAVGGSARSSR